MNSTANVLYVNDSLKAHNPYFFEYFSSIFFETRWNEYVNCLLFSYFLFFFNMGYFALNAVVSNRVRSGDGGMRKESICCLAILIIYGILFCCSPPVLYELVSDDYYSKNHISSEILKNLSLFVRILSSYLVVVFAFNCYYIVFRGSAKQKDSNFYIYLFITVAFIFSLLLTLFLWLLRYSFLDKSNPYCHFNLMPSVQSVYCPDTKYWMVFTLCVYIIPIFILFVVYPMVIYKLLKTEYKIFIYFADHNCKKFLFLSDCQFLKLSFIITLIFLVTNIPFVIIEILCILRFKINIIGIIFSEFIARYVTISYPWISSMCMHNNATAKKLAVSICDFINLSSQVNCLPMQSLLVDCEAVIKEQEELLKVMRVHVKTVSGTEGKSKFTSEVQTSSSKL